MPKKSFTKADKAIDNFFTQGTQDVSPAHVVFDTQLSLDTQDAFNEQLASYAQVVSPTHDVSHTQHVSPTQHVSHTHNTHKKRLGILLDESLKNDLDNLAMAKGNKSTNELVVAVLHEYVHRKENKAKLEQYLRLLQG